MKSSIMQKWLKKQMTTSFRDSCILFSIIFLFTFCTVSCSSNNGDDSDFENSNYSQGPEAPSQIIANGGKERVILYWLPVTGVDSFNVYYAKTFGVTRENATLVSDSHSPFTQRDLENGVTYYFAVASVDAQGEGPLSNEVSAVPSNPSPPYAPEDVSAISGSGQVQLSWSSSINATGHNIYYGEEIGVTHLTGTKISDVSSPYSIEQLENDVTYYFVVTAENENGESTTSFEVSAMPVASPPPSAPANVTATEANGAVNLNWQAVDNVQTYNVYYSTEFYLNKESATKIADAGDPPVTVSDLTNKTAYFFFVTSENEDGESGVSATVSATPISEKPVHGLVEIPAGEFQMGDNLDGNDYAMPVHMVYVDTFYIDRYETTYDLWKTVYDWAIENNYEFDNEGLNGSHDIGTNLPVTVIHWYDVVKWLNARSEKEGRSPVYFTDLSHLSVYRSGQVDLTSDMVNWTADGYRLPTEAEWEKAMRGNQIGLRYPWGDELGGASNGNYNMGRAVSVGTYPPNGYGLYDMAGNVWEWVWDLASDNYDWALDGIINPYGPETNDNQYRVRRGGAYTYGFIYLRCYERMMRRPTYTATYFGFRAASISP